MNRTALIAVLLLAVGYVVACSTTPKFAAPPEFTPPVAATQVSPSANRTVQGVGAVVPLVAAATQIAPALTVANVDEQRPVLVSWLTKAWDALGVAVKSAADTETQAKAADAASAKLLADVQARDKALATATATINQQNGTVANLNQKIKTMQDSQIEKALWAGLILCVLAAAGGAYVAFKGDLANGLAIVGGGAAGITFCILAMTLENFAYTHEAEIGYGACALGVLVLAGGGYLAYRKLHEATGSIIQANQAAIVTGNLPMAGAAPIFRAVQTPLAEKLVNRFAPKDLNGSGNVAARAS